MILTQDAETHRVALVTGGSRGIGFGCALQLARNGFDLCICGRRPEGEVAGALETLRAEGVAVMYTLCDVSEATQRDAMLATVRERFGRLDLLVNNAGVAPKQRLDILEATEESFEWVLRVNLQGPYFLTQGVARWMVAQRAADAGFQGRIINVSSISATVASPSRGEYCVSKAGVSMATQLWAVRLAESGIGVYEVRPGIIETDMTSGVKEKYDQLIGEGLIPQGRWGTPEDIGRTVAALARGDMPYSTGLVVVADGGLTLQRL